MKPKRFHFRDTPLFSSVLRYGTPVCIGFAVFVSGLSAEASDILRGGGAGRVGVPLAGSLSGGTTPAAADAARTNVRDTLTRTADALAAVRAMQAAARAAASTTANPLSSGKTGVPPVTADSASRLSAYGTTGGTPVGQDRLEADPPAVPNGFVPNGLWVPSADLTNPAKWSGAAAPAHTESADGTTATVTVKQTTQQALLNWQTFNVGKGTTLTFDQSAGGANVNQWIAFNKVSDPTGNPTQILGSIKADGQVYVINPNGIIFGGSSQVNARNLTASSLPIDDNLIHRGLLNNPDAQFLFSGLAIPAGINGTPAFIPDAPPGPSGRYGDVIVQQGAILESPSNAAKVGGRITLVGPNVINNGSISTPDGQTILAAGLQVGFDGHASSDASLRGLDVFVGAVADPVAGLYAGVVTQDGLIEAIRGSTTIAGREIDQNGSLVSSTSVALNGRIDLQAQYNAVSNRSTATTIGGLFLFSATGAVNLAPNSVISILPEYVSTETTVGTELALRSQVNAVGKTIRLGAGSILSAPNASVNLTAGTWLFQASSPPLATFVQSGGQVYFENGALIDVAGSVAVPVPVSQNIISVDLRAAELADSPLQRLGTLRATTVLVDIRNKGNGWIGTPLANVSGFANLIQRSVGQLTVAGGSVTISAGDSVVMQTGSKIDVSGGSTQFESGLIQTTQLITGGHLVDIGSASPNVVYDGIYDGTFTQANAKFGVSDVYHGVIAPAGYRYDPGYTEGGAGGKLSISAPAMALDGGFTGSTVVGDNQRLTPPAASTLSLTFQAQDIISYPNYYPIYSPAPPTVTFDSTVILAPAAPFAVDANGNPSALRADRRNTVVLSPGLLAADGFGSLTVNNHDGAIIVPAGVDLAAPVGGSIAFKASNITVAGPITAPGGSLAFSTYGIGYDEINQLHYIPPVAPPTVQPGRGIFTLGSGGILSTAGLTVDDRLSPGSSLVSPVSLNGGTINIAGYSANLAAGGLVDVSGGGMLSAKGVASYGNAGSLTITAGRELGFSSTLGGTLDLGARIQGLSGGTAGTLAITAPALQIGGGTSNPEGTLVDPGFFSQGGFGNISLTGIALAGSRAGSFVPGIRIADGTEIRPVVQGWLGSLDPNDQFKLSPITREEGVRSPANLSFTALGASFAGVILTRGDLVMGQGALIQTDGLGSVSFNGQTVTLLGSVMAPGGSISVTGPGSFPINAGQLPTRALPNVILGAGATLSTQGKEVLVSNPFGLRQGRILAGGSIRVSGNIVAEAGAKINVSGASGILDLPPSSQSLDPAVLKSLKGNATVPVTVESNAGTITLAGGEMLFSDATLLGAAGGHSATGGSLIISSNKFVPDGVAYTTADVNLVVTQSSIALPATNSSIGIGVPVLDAGGNIAPQLGYFSVDRFATGGFDSLNLGGNVRFDGDVSIAVPGSLKVADGGVIQANGNVTLTAAHVVLGQAFQAPAQQAPALFYQGIVGYLTPYSFSPTWGTGKLTVHADLIDVGNLSLEGIGNAALLALTGDIRGNGTLQIAGDLTLEAGQIYPPTERQFHVFAYDYHSAGMPHQGSVTIQGGTTRSLPFSAGGELSIYASQISQGGTLRAPIGKIHLGWDGTGTAPTNAIAGTTHASPVTSLLTLATGGVTSVSTIDPVTGKATILPYGISLDGKSWIDPAGNDITVSGPPAKAVNLAAVNLVTQAGSTVDISGGGDLYAYRWISGNGGSKDILASSGSFAVIPTYGFTYSPYAPFNSDTSATNLGGASGYTNSTLREGDQITLAASKDLPAGTYTLLPARYALLPGAVLVTPKSSVPDSTITLPGGASLVAGYRSNNLDPSRSGPTLIGGFEVAPAKVVRARAEYQDLLANTVLRDAAISRELTVPRLPVDAGYLAFSSSAGMVLDGAVSSLVPTGGRGSVIDINSASQILINPTGTAGTATGLVLSAQVLNSFGAESLLIGGIRSFTADGANVTANSPNVILDNAGTALTGKDIILVSSDHLTLEDGARILSTKGDLTLETLTLGKDGTAGSGNGSLVRVSASSTGQVARHGIDTSTSPELVIRPGVMLTGGNIVLDSTAATSLANSANLLADSISLSSGQISISLNNPGTLNPTTGLVLGGQALASLQNSAKRLALLSYSTIDVYGTGAVGSRSFDSLSLQASAIRGFNAAAGSVTFTAANLSLGNSAASAPSSPLSGPLAGSVTFDADQITLGANSLRIDGYADALLTATGSVLTENQGLLDAAGNLDLVTPLVTGAGKSIYQIRAAGTLRLDRPAVSRPSPFGGGFGADLTLQGASVQVNGGITLPSGKLTLHATSGDLTLGDTAAAHLDLTGTSTTFVDTIRYTGGGTVKLLADAGSVRVAAAAGIDVSAKQGGGNAGAVVVKSAGGVFDLAGTIAGTAGSTGKQGSFTLDTGSVAGGSLASLDAILNAGGFTWSRDYRIRTGNVMIDGMAESHIYQVAADSGSITVSNTIDASGTTGGIIDLKASGSLTLSSGSVLDASGVQFDDAGKGGAITLEAGNQRNGVIDPGALLDLQSGSTINLSIAAANTTSESLGKFTGTLHLRAPRNPANTDMRINAIGSSIAGASSILVEGVKLYGITGTGTITTTIQNSIKSDATAFLGAAGAAATPGYSAMLGRLTSLQPTLHPILAPGAEIFNAAGNLVLGTTTSTATSDWNLQTFRFGPQVAPGVLTLRAAGDIVFYNALSDGFAAVTPTTGSTGNGNSALWLAPLMARNALLPANTQSWSYRISSGADFSSADFRAVLPGTSLATDKGSVLLGKNYGNANFGSGSTFTTATAINGRYQVIRTGSGDITINSARNVYLLNQFASIYTAGTVVSDPTKVIASGDFVVPLLLNSAGAHPSQGVLGAIQQKYFVQYSMAGGNVSITAAGDIARKTRMLDGTLIDDSSRELPNNWLDRRGFIDPITGGSGVVGVGTLNGTSSSDLTDPNASTTWWVDFSNFFEGVGTLGGGNIRLAAGNDVKNMDALAPTNARMASGTPSASKMIELGGGDITVLAGHNIDGGVYYVERGAGILTAGNVITTNNTRSPSRGILQSLSNPDLNPDSNTWLPTTFFVGKGGFDVQAGGDLLLGPSANPFLLPQGINNKFWYKTYLNTFGAGSYVNAISLGGTVTLRTEATLSAETSAVPVLESWSLSQYYLPTLNSPASIQPWLRLAESEVYPFATLSSLMAPRLAVTSLAGDIKLAGNVTLFPSPTGQVELVARNSIVGLQPTGFMNSYGVANWVTSTINLSDTDPASIPGITSPYAYFQLVDRSASAQRLTNQGLGAGFLDGIDARFAETGSTGGALQDKQPLHTAGGLHLDDSQPLRMYAADGNIEGIELFSPKEARVIAGNDMGDVAFYIQNLSASDLSVVSAGRDLTLYNGNSESRISANADIASNPAVQLTPLAGDIQISGPGSLEVLAGRNLDLGLGNGNPDGTGVGITSIGNNRNPYLGFDGAGITVGAGIGLATSLAGSTLAFDDFITHFATSPAGDRYLAESMGILGVTTDYEGTKTLAAGVKIKSVTAGGPADQAGLMAGDVILKLGAKDLGAGYDDSYLASGITPGTATTMQVLRDGKTLDLNITPGSKLLNLADYVHQPEQRTQLALSLFYLALRDAGRDFNDPASPGYRKYDNGFAAIKALFPESVSWQGEILTQSRDIRTRSGGDIRIFAPGGGVTMANTTIGNPLTPPGIVTESGGNISIFTHNSVNIGIGRIFTLKGGNAAIWSSTGDIAAGSSSRTLSAAPPTRVIIDPQSASVETDLAGLATGGGIGVLATVEGVAPGNVDLIAPAGVIDAGDAGIRVSGNINLAAVTVVNAGNISAAGTSTGAPVAASAPSVSTVTSASNATTAAGSTAVKAGDEQKPAEQPKVEEALSVITVEVIGYGGASGDEDDKDKEQDNTQAPAV